MHAANEKAVEARARRAARRRGLRATKSRWRAGSCDNQGGFQLINERNWIVAGVRFDLSADDVLDYCADV